MYKLTCMYVGGMLVRGGTALCPPPRPPGGVICTSLVLGNSATNVHKKLNRLQNINSYSENFHFTKKTIIFNAILKLLPT